MDPGEVRSSGGRFETFDANARFVVIRDDEGYGIWRLDDVEDGEPIERFPDDDDGYERAAERGNTSRGRTVAVTGGGFHASSGSS